MRVRYLCAFRVVRVVVTDMGMVGALPTIYIYRFHCPFSRVMPGHSLDSIGLNCVQEMGVLSLTVDCNLASRAEFKGNALVCI